MALSTGQVNDAYKKALGRDPTGQELQQYTNDNSYDGSSGQNALISKLGGGVATPGNSSQVQGALNDFHNLVLQATSELNEPQISDETRLANIKQRVLPANPVPTAPNMLQAYESLRADPNITNLETSLSDLKKQENAIIDQVQATQSAEGTKPVATNVIAGRQTEEGRQAQLQLDSLSRRKAVIVDELQTRFNMIDTVMQFMQLDYENATKEWTTQFQANLSIYDAFNSEIQAEKAQRMETYKLAINAASQEVQWAQEQEQFEYQQAQDTIRNASANLTIFANLIKDGNMSFDQFTPEQKLQVQKLEIQSGLGTGFIEKLRADNPEGKVIYAGANGAVLQLGDGSLKTVNYNVSGKSGTDSMTKDEKYSSALTEMRPVVLKALNSYNDISPNDWNKLLAQWTAVPGLSKDDFVKEFGQYTDTNRGDFYQAYGFKNPNPPKAKENKLP